LLLGLAVGALGGIPVHAQRGLNPVPDLLNADRPDAEEGRRVLEAFRSQGISGDYFLSFELRVLPRRGAEQIIPGRLWGTRGPQGDVNRVGLVTPAGELRLLVRNGAEPDVWQWREGSEVAAMSPSEMQTAIAGTDLTPFDLLRPFLFWTDTYEGIRRVNGRPAHQFRLEAPAEFRTGREDALAAVRVSIDSQYLAMVQAEYLDDRDQVTKTLTVLELKKLGEQWIVRSLDLRNEATRDKTRFQVSAAALNLNLPEVMFAPQALAELQELPTPVMPVD